jgi:hypothetical protein
VHRRSGCGRGDGGYRFDDKILEAAKQFSFGKGFLYDPPHVGVFGLQAGRLGCGCGVVKKPDRR